MRLNLTGWQKLGIVLSIVWVVGAAIYQRSSDLDRAQSFAAFAYKTCADAKEIRGDKDLASCELEKQEHIAVFMQGSWGSVAFLVLVPIPFGWIAAYVLAGLGRAVFIGLRVVLPWKEMSRWRKAFVVVGVVTSFFAAMFGVTAGLNLYTDTLVPVALAPFNRVMELPEGVVVAEGTWTREGSGGEGSALAYPLQTSKITCTRAERRCIEARASVSGNLLTAELVEYEIESWSKTTIVFKNEAPCAVEVFTIDRSTESVNGVGHPINPDWKVCNMRTNFPRETKWAYHLGNGFNTYWQLRQKARPLPLRLIQALFGN